MRFLFTSDWQTEWSNLDVCQQAWSQIIDIHREYKLEGVAVLGDLKRAYDPVNVSVTRFWTDLIDQAVRGYQLKVLLLLGNHDRIGMYEDAQNWFSILRRKGAMAYDKPALIRLEELGTEMLSGYFAMLPYTSQVNLWKKRTRFLQQQVTDPSKTVLLFHQELNGAQYSVQSVHADTQFGISDLGMENYALALGGHIHKRQQVAEKVWYVGSPFATDWGEANQVKGFTLVDNFKPKFIPSNIPGWYDPTWPSFKPPKSWNGCRIRIHASCPLGSNITAILDQARVEAEKKYPGSLVYVVPEFTEDNRPEKITVRTTDSDEQKVEQYVAQTLPEEQAADKHRIIQYLCYKLKRASGGRLLRHGHEIKLLGGHGQNFLSYMNLDLDYQNQGLVLVTGMNLDWPGGKSNGSGKTCLLSLLPVALFGRTFKGQQHDAWGRRGVEEECCAEVSFEDHKGRKIRVKRLRHPSALYLEVDGEDQSSGLGAAAGKTGTQGLVEQLTGFTFETFANSVYIDQRMVSTFLEGTPGERKKILERFQNLERFSTAHQLAKEDLRVIEQHVEDISTELNVDKQLEANYRAMLQSVSGMDVIALAAKAKQAYTSLLREKNIGYQKLEQLSAGFAERKQVLESNLELARNTATEATTEKYKWEGAISHDREEIGKRQRLSKSGDLCPTCGNRLNKAVIAQVVQKIQMRCDHQQKLVTKASDKELVLLVRVDVAEAEYDSLISELDEARLTYSNADQSVQEAKTSWQELQKKADAATNTKRTWENKLVNVQRRVKKLEQAKRSYTQDHVRQTYCVQSFSNSGLPAFLNSQLCPILNQAANYYSGLFCEKHIQVRFQMNESEFDVQVINVHGGETLDDQSAGEAKMAALITVFALREVAPQCNVLILDEPGDGLDAANARAFAAGIRQLKKRFSTILVTTHNQNILSELSGEKVIVVEKKNRVSSVRQ